LTDLSSAGASLPEISPTELNERLERSEPLILVDVRESHEQAIADLPERGQRRIPLGEFLDRMDELRAEEPVVLYCRSGARSAWATRQLLSHGFENVWNLKGGLLGWKDEVDPSIQEY
jgi:sulfur-carrier protein adenylyltransferase/sulfurtransferase